MSGDYSRIDYDPLRDYNGVLLQQGRPLTDRDWNDLVALLDRRIQAGALDASGQTFVSGATPDAFKIASDGKGGLLIGRGRLYVDGLLAENHGTGTPRWDQELAELYGADAVPYDKQPNLPNPPALPKTGGPYVVYLDVWEREVTRYEDSGIVEQALGVDTTTRVQTVWQVKLLDPGASVDCATPLDKNKAWIAATAPSAGRLSIATGDVPGDVNPCIIPPAGGYKGLENQLYRVEIHKKGPLGTATFKWSRDNASVATQVTQITDPLHIVVESVGKDAVLNFAGDMWIEITDDWLEKRGLPGELHKIKVVETATRTITLEKALTAGLFPTDALGNVDASRHTRIRRWDQKNKILDNNGKVYWDLDAAGSDGAIPVPTGGLQLLLESGILVSFDADPGGGEFHVGDYWVSAARTTDASIETFTKAPPRGIHHHYAKLAVFTPPGGIEDCRPTAEACCCSVTVRPGEDIQAAINALPDAGGCVCLKTGTHLIKSAITITRSSVKLAGESIGAIVRLQGDGLVLGIGAADGVWIEGIEISDIHFDRAGKAAGSPVIGATRTKFSVIQACRIDDVPQQSIGIQLVDCDAFRIARCAIASASIGIAASGKLGRMLSFDQNVIGGAAARDAAPPQCGIVVQEITGPCRISANAISDALAGIIVNDDVTMPLSHAAGSAVTANTVSCGALAAGAKPDKSTALIGIDMAASHSIVAGNTITFSIANTAGHTGIRATGHDVVVADNAIAGRGERPLTKPIGIAIGFISDDNKAVATGAVRAGGNAITGLPAGIAATDAANVIADRNVIEGSGDVTDPTTGVGISLTRILGGQVRNNTVAGTAIGIACLSGAMNAITGNILANGGYGIGITQELEPTVAQNRITNMTNWGLTLLGTAGRCEATDNRLASCGYGMPLGAAIAAYVVLGELNIAGNEIANTGLSLDAATLATTALGIAGALVLEARVAGNLVTYADVNKRPATGNDRALLMMGYLEASSVWAAGVVTVGYPINITDNTFAGPGAGALVQLVQVAWGNNVFSRFERVFFSDNHCTHVTATGNGATVLLVGRAAIAIGNHIKATMPKFPSIDFGNQPGPCIGNVLAGPVLNHATAPPLDAGFNLTM